MNIRYACMHHLLTLNGSLSVILRSLAIHTSELRNRKSCVLCQFCASKLQKGRKIAALAAFVSWAWSRMSNCLLLNDLTWQQHFYLLMYMMCVCVCVWPAINISWQVLLILPYFFLFCFSCKIFLADFTSIHHLLSIYLLIYIYIYSGFAHIWVLCLHLLESSSASSLESS